MTVAATLTAIAWALTADARESLFLDKRQDLGHFTQAIWATAHGHFLQVTEAGGTNVSRLGIHVDPIIAAFTPLWLVWPSPQLLLTVQAIALAVGALPIYWLGRKHLVREREAALLAVAYLLCPTVGWNAVSDFHPICLAVPSLLFAVWHLDESRWIAFTGTAGVAVLCQEQVGLLVGCLGLWHLLRTHRTRAGLAIAVSGFAVSAFDFFVVLRHFSGASPFANRFGGSAPTLIGDLFTHPLRLTSQLGPHDLSGFLLAVPVLGCCFGSALILAAAPQVALLLLSRRAEDWVWFGINVLVIIPFVYSSTVFALAAPRTTIWRRVGARKVFTASLVTAAVVGPFGILAVPRPLFSFETSVHAQQTAVGLIPKNASVSATNHLALPLSARRSIYTFPVIGKADWVAIDERDDALPDMAYLRHRKGISTGVNDLYSQPELMRSKLDELRGSQQWELVYKSDNVYVFKRVGRQAH